MRDSRRTRVVLALLLLASVTLIMLDARSSSGPAAWLRSTAQSIWAPVQTAFSGVVGPVVEFFDGLGADEQARLDELERENAELRAQLRTSELARNRAAELDALLRIAGAGQYRTVPAQVIAVGPAQGFASTATIDAGEIDGLRPEMTVLNGDGLVGRVKSVTRTTALVVLLKDATSSVGARLEGSMDLGILTGDGTDTLALRVLDPQVTIAADDRVVTFGSSGGSPYVPGVPIGAVSRVESTPGQLVRLATVKPYVDFSALDLVGVVIEAPAGGPPRQRAAAQAGAEPRARPGACPRPRGDPHAQPRGVPLEPRMSPRHALLAAALLLPALLLQNVLLWRLPLPGATPDLLLLVMMGLAVVWGPREGALLGFLSGLALDLVSPGDGPVGQWALIFCLAGWIAGLAADAVERSALVVLLLVAGVAAGAVVAYALVGGFLSDPRVSWEALRSVLPWAVAYDVLLTPFVVPPVIALARRVDPRERRYSVPLAVPR